MENTQAYYSLGKYTIPIQLSPQNNELLRVWGLISRQTQYNLGAQTWPTKECFAIPPAFSFPPYPTVHL